MLGVVPCRWHSRGRLPCATPRRALGVACRRGPFQVSPEFLAAYVKSCACRQGSSWWAELSLTCFQAKSLIWPRGWRLRGSPPRSAESQQPLPLAQVRGCPTCKTCPSSRTCSRGLGEKGSPFWSHEMVGIGLPRAGHCRLTVLLALTVISSTSSSVSPRITGGAGVGERREE